MSKSGQENNIPIKPKHFPGSPPKDFHEKNAIGFFACLRYSLGCKCPELLRVRAVRNEVYLIPFVEDKTENVDKRRDFHISYHPSGEFHWTVNGAHVKPVFGEDDFLMAFHFWLVAKAPSCLCFRRGKGLSEQDIIAAVQTLSRYVPVQHSIEGISNKLNKDGFYRFILSV